MGTTETFFCGKSVNCPYKRYFPKVSVVPGFKKANKIDAPIYIYIYIHISLSRYIYILDLKASLRSAWGLALALGPGSGNLDPNPPESPAQIYY